LGDYFIEAIISLSIVYRLSSLSSVAIKGRAHTMIRKHYGHEDAS